MFQHKDDPNKFMFLERWSSLEAHQENIAKNVEGSGHLEKIKAVLAGPPDHSLVDLI